MAATDRTDAGADRLSALTGEERGPVRTGAGLTVLSALLWPGQAALIAWVFATLLSGSGAPQAGLAALGFLALGLFRTGLIWWGEGLIFRAAEAILSRQRDIILRREAVSAAPSGFGGPGAIAALASEKLDALSPYITRYAPAQARVLVVPPVLLALALWQSWAVAVILMITGPLIPVFMALVGYAAREASERQMVEIGALNDLMIDRLSALSDIRLLNAETQVAGRFAEAAENLRARTMAVLRVAFLSSTVLELFAAIGVAMVAVWVGFALLGEINWGGWGGGVTPFGGMFVLLLAPEFYQPLRDLAAAWHDRAAALAVAGELTEWEAEAPAPILGTGDDVVPLAGAASVEISGLVVRRGGWTVRCPDFALAPGESLALTGPSGAGKTTLLRLLAGLEQAESGEILVAGARLDDDTADAWRARLGWMPQAPHFLNRSLRFNIGFGAALSADLLDRAVLGEVIEGLPKGDLTVLGETGGGLSGGEARRVMLARAVQAAPDVVLADEPTADLDAETAAQVTDGLLALAGRGATLIVATHDPEVMSRLGRVIEVEGEG